jgi:hypothetical protein
MFSQEDLQEPQVQEGGERKWDGDDDMNEFDRMMKASVNEAERLREEAQRQAREEAERMMLERQERLRK